MKAWKILILIIILIITITCLIKYNKYELLYMLTDLSFVPIPLGNRLSHYCYGLALGSKSSKYISVLDSDVKITLPEKSYKLDKIKSVSFWEFYPLTCAEIALHCVKPRVIKNKVEVERGIVRIHIRCSDTPYNRHTGYEFLKYNWYIRALTLLRKHMTIRKIVIHLCTDHSLSMIMKITDELCNQYSMGLRDYLGKEGSENVELQVSCNKVLDDFLMFQSSDGFIAGGCGGSFSYFAGVLSSGRGVILPMTNHPEKREKIGRDYPFGEGRWFISGERIPHEDVDSYDNIEEVIDLCKSK
jgi:hypothetical protein